MISWDPRGGKRSPILAAKSFLFSSRRRHTRCGRDWSSDVCSSDLKEILNDYYPTYTPEDLLAFYLFTGGVAKYVELLVQAEAFTFEAMLNEIMSENSLFLEEGKNVLIDEFGKDYGNYFSILSLIASGKTSRVEIESIMEIQTGGFLERLENEYGLIKKVRPILAKPNSRTVKYSIEDNFLKFWFRFIYKYRSAVEAGNLEIGRASCRERV